MIGAQSSGSAVRVLRYSQNKVAGEGEALGLITIVNQDPVRYTQKKEL